MENTVEVPLWVIILFCMLSIALNFLIVWALGKSKGPIINTDESGYTLDNNDRELIDRYYQEMKKRNP